MRVASSPEDHPFREQYPPVVERGQRHSSYGPKSESVAIQQYYDLTSLKKSLVRMNDELIPKPTEIKIGEKQIQLPFPAEHPYQSHISRFALFPSLGSPDDLTCGVRAAARLPLNPLAPAGGYDITVLSKTKGTEPSLLARPTNLSSVK
ncbi:sperm-associated microtubule inner protein 4 isoform X2 [Amia ocellicauda]|uniref:sperm-associated microtubule inner protein 4 isoform X2 n=1 Tax=Amia ocellicauda TaxID=2972642 RepID=UPI00346489EC